ncbi:hypothetical protein IPJ72_03355 [Candidatus Peregrinibacteria bacterium]|nr:MAG: hypothetical protein IPJ72_03355 [Candidatus Peregrinibacteria bacterium]
MKRAKVSIGENKMHSGGHNELIRTMKGDVYLCASNDMLYPKGLLSDWIHAFEPVMNEYGSSAIKLLQWQSNGYQIDTKLIPKRLDSMGLGIRRNHHFYDAGQGEVDTGQYDAVNEAFGPSAALALYTKAALDAISYQNEVGKLEYFDELLHFKNDVDLAYRLQWAGFRCRVFPQFYAQHARGTGAKGSVLGSRKHKGRFEKDNSFWGQQVVLYKNMDARFAFVTRLASLTRQLLMIGYALFFERHLIRVLRKLKQSEKALELRRKAVVKNVKPIIIEALMC